jgi:hypothetical protein
MDISLLNCILFLFTGGYCLQQLLTWVKWHFNDPDQLGQTVMTSDDPYSHPDYWSTVSLLYIQ